VGEGQAAQELQPSSEEDRRRADILAVLFASQEQAALHQDLPVLDKGEKVDPEEAKETGDCQPQKGQD